MNEFKNREADGIFKQYFKNPKKKIKGIKFIIKILKNKTKHGFLFLRPFMGWQGHNRNMHRAKNCPKGMRGSFVRLQVLTLAVRWCVQGAKMELRGFQGDVYRAWEVFAGRARNGYRGWQGMHRLCQGIQCRWQGKTGLFIRIGVFRSNRFTLLWL